MVGWQRVGGGLVAGWWQVGGGLAAGRQQVSSPSFTSSPSLSSEDSSFFFFVFFFPPFVLGSDLKIGNVII